MIKLSYKARLKRMVNLREKNYTYQEIGDVFGITRERVRQCLAKLDKDGRLTCAYRRYVDTIDVDNFIDNYKILDRKQLCKHYKVSYSTLDYFCKELRIAETVSSLYPDIHNPDKDTAFLLGYIYSRGSFYSKRNTVQVTISGVSGTDMGDYIINIQHKYFPTHPIGYANIYKHSYVRLCLPTNFSRQLAEIGFGNSETKVCPTFKDKEYLHQFLAGYRFGRSRQPKAVDDFWGQTNFITSLNKEILRLDPSIKTSLTKTYYGLRLSLV